MQRTLIPWVKNPDGTHKLSIVRRLAMAKTRNVGKDNPFYGRHHSPEQRKRWSEQRKGHGASRFPYIPPDLTRERLDELYLKQKLSRSKISVLTGYSDWTIEKALEIYGISKRNRTEVMIIANQGRPLPTGGRRIEEGYVLIYKPDHHRANRHRYVWEHILVWEETSGRLLPDGWIVHHINGCKNDNRPQNLMAMPRKSHHYALLLQATRKRIRELEAELNRYKSQMILGGDNAQEQN